MSKTQHSPLAPPSSPDREVLKDFTSKIQEGLEELYFDSHSHGVKTADPADNEGEIGDIIPIDDGTNKYLVVRYSSGWFKTANLTAI